MKKGQMILGLVNIGGFIAITVLMILATKFGNEWAMKVSADNLPLLIGCWITNATTVVNYVFGSSQSSQDKNEIIAGVTKK